MLHNHGGGSDGQTDACRHVQIDFGCVCVCVCVFVHTNRCFVTMSLCLCFCVSVFLARAYSGHTFPIFIDLGERDTHIVTHSPFEPHRFLDTHSHTHTARHTSVEIRYNVNKADAMKNMHN